MRGKPWAVLLLVLLGPGAQSAEGNAWLVGTWQLAEDRKTPGFTDDYMDFEANGAVTLRDGKRAYANCSYTPTGATVLLKCVVRGKEKLLSFQVASDRRSIANPQGDIYRKRR